MRNAIWKLVILLILLLTIGSTLLLSCKTSSSIVGKWEGTWANSSSNPAHVDITGFYLESSSDGHIVQSLGDTRELGTYERFGEENIKVSLEGTPGLYLRSIGADVWKVHVNGNSMTVQYGGTNLNYKRVR